ncbi:MAG: Penicillin-binding protein 1A [Saprospiraceae bacterium]|jgi:penicillin-binding protein 1A|nr:Penicillin-binding protein 1A [Saprospiraceae bacterium]
MSYKERLTAFLRQFCREFVFTDALSGKSGEDKAWFSVCVLFFWKLFFGGLVAFYAIMLLVSFDNLPSFEDLENPNYHQATIIYANDKSILGKLFTENREFTPYDSLNPQLVRSLLATEDSRFYQHSGIDFFALMRVAVRTLLLRQEESGGGSTVTQQLAKLLFERPSLEDKGALARKVLLVRTKFKEWLVALKLERRYTKEEIISMYLNKFDFLYGANGVQTAAQTYFGKDQTDLLADEAAMLIGMLKNPARYNPKRSPKSAEGRRNTVLTLMYRDGQLTKTEWKDLMEKPIDVTQFKRDSHLEGMALYFRAELAEWLKDLLEDEKYRKPDGSRYNPYLDGLKVYTTIQPEYQAFAEQAARDHMRNIQKSYFNVWNKRDPWTFGGEKEQIAIRNEALNQSIRETERYQQLWNSHFGNALNLLENEVGNVDVNDHTIQRLLREENRKGSLKQELQKKQINEKQFEYSQRILRSKAWPQIKKAWPRFEQAVKKVMSTPVKLRVYNYLTAGERDTVMSPLDSIKYHRKHMQIGSLAMDPQTGEIKAWVGGTNFKYFKYDHVQSRRQVGSTFKPFVYTTAIALQGISPCAEFEDIRYTIPANDPNFQLPKPWSPGNAADDFSGERMNLYKALALSKNSITVKLVILLGSVEPIRGLLHNMGIDSSLKRRDGGYLIPKFPSIVLGSSDLSVMEMTGAYGTFANNGVYTKPHFVSRIEDKNGKVIYRHTAVRNVAISPNYNYVMLDLLRRSGGNWALKTPNGGKTGTTNDYVDGWFMGVTPRLVVGTWVGGDDPWIRFLDLGMGQGSRMAKPYFTTFMKLLEENPESGFATDVDFIHPPGNLGIELDCEAYRLFLEQGQSGESMIPGNRPVQQDEIFEDE